MWYVFSYILSICKCEKEIEFDAETIEVLKAIYRETDFNLSSEEEVVEETDSEDSDYEPPEDLDDDESSEEEEEESEEEDVSQDVSEEIIIKKDAEGNYYLY